MKFRFYKARNVFTFIFGKLDFSKNQLTAFTMNML